MNLIVCFKAQNQEITQTIPVQILREIKCISLILLICAGFSAYAGASQLEQAKQHAKCSLDAFTKRRNGVSCICLSILFVILGVAINL